MNRSPAPLYILIICLSWALLGCAGLGPGHVPEPRPKYEDIDIGALIETFDGYLYAVHYPITHYPEVDEAILAYVQERVAAFQRTAREAPAAPVERWPLELIIDFTVEYEDENWFSILLVESVYSGNAKVREDLATWNIDRRQGRIIPLSRLFQAQRDYLTRLSTIAKAHLLQERPDDMAPADYEAWVAAVTQPDPAAFEHYLVTDAGLVFYFDQYRLDPPVHPQTLIPWSGVADLLLDGALPPDVAHAVPGTAEPGPGEPNSGDDPDGEEPDIAAEPGEESLPVAGDPAGNGEPPGDGMPGEGPAAGDEGVHATGGLPDGEPSPRPKRAALTFDDGPHNTVTPMILDILQGKGVPATFFVLGNRVDFYPELLQRMVAEGHEIGNHSWNHARLTRLSPAEIAAQIERTQEAVYAWTGQRPLVVRPPYGAINSRVSEAIPMPLVLWSVDTRDWESRDRDQIMAEALTAVHDGAIILFHDLFPSTAEALAEIIDALHRQGYELVTVSQLLGFEDQEVWARFAGQPVRHQEPGSGPAPGSLPVEGAAKPQ